MNPLTARRIFATLGLKAPVGNEAPSGESLRCRRRRDLTITPALPQLRPWQPQPITLEKVDMSNIFKQNLVVAFLLALLVPCFPGMAAPSSEDSLIKDLDSPKDSVVTSALLKLEKQYPTSTKAFPKMKELLTDSRAPVRRKAARVLGVLHADVSDADIKAITALLKSADPKEVGDGLIALRGLKASQTVPEILPLLKHSTPNVIRDACRTLAVHGSKDLIPQIEPLLQHPNAAVKKDAQDAIFNLRSKP